MTKVTTNFSYKEFDLEGLETLEAMAEAPRLNVWMYETISKNLEGEILEIGSGIGNISDCFVENKRSIHLSDLRPNYLALLHQQFKDRPQVKGIHNIDLVHPQFDTKYAHLLNTFDGLFALNVVEHIEDDNQAIANAQKLLKKGGRLLILVPAYPFLYNGFDTALEHYRRYTKASLSKLFKNNALKITHRSYFNFVGIFGWFFSGTILRKKIIPKGQMKIYNALVPLFRWIDRLTGRRMGLSVIVEGVK